MFYVHSLCSKTGNFLTSSNRQSAASYNEHRPSEVRVGSLHWLRSADEP